MPEPGNSLSCNVERGLGRHLYVDGYALALDPALDHPTQFDDPAPLMHARPDAPPTFVALAQYENPLIDVYALELAHHLAQIHDTHGGPMPRVLQLPDHNHYSVMAQFNTAHNTLGAEIRDWCARVERGEFAARRRV